MPQTPTPTFLDGRITIDPAICNGKPTLRGKRITVHPILDFLKGETMAIKFVVCLQKQDLDDFSGALISLTAGLKPGVFKTPGRHARWLASPTISRDFPL